MKRINDLELLKIKEGEARKLLNLTKRPQLNLVK